MSQKRWIVEIAYSTIQPADESAKWFPASDTIYTDRAIAEKEAHLENYGCYARVRRTDQVKGKLVSWPDPWEGYDLYEAERNDHTAVFLPL